MESRAAHVTFTRTDGENAGDTVGIGCRSPATGSLFFLRPGRSRALFVEWVDACIRIAGRGGRGSRLERGRRSASARRFIGRPTKHFIKRVVSATVSELNIIRHRRPARCAGVNSSIQTRRRGQLERGHGGTSKDAGGAARRGAAAVGTFRNPAVEAHISSRGVITQEETQ